jgi:hypothetical protein
MNTTIKSQFNIVMGLKPQIVIDKVISSDDKLYYLKKVLTAGHGYYAIDKNNHLFNLAVLYCKFNGSKTFNQDYVFLEEDSEIYDFLKRISLSS